MNITIDSSIKEKEAWLLSFPAVHERGRVAWRQIFSTLDERSKNALFKILLNDQSVIETLTDYAVTVVDHAKYNVPEDALRSQIARVMEASYR